MPTVAKSTSLFNDPTEKIQELVYIIKQDIQYLDKKIVELDQLVRSQRAGTDQAHTHSDTIVDALKSNLRNATQNFTKVLEMRSETMKAQQEKRERFTGSRLSVAAQTSQAQFNSGGFGSGFDQPEENNEHEVALPMVTMQSSVIEQRSSAVRAIEQTIHDLQRIFQHLAQLTHEQDAQIRRIDDNVNATVLNVEGAHKQLVTYLAKVSNDRWLILKVFGILLLFIFIFVVFFA
jgi:syntaxin 5